MDRPTLEHPLFRERDRQAGSRGSAHLLPGEKIKRLNRFWAQQFWDRALPLIKDDPFTVMYRADAR